MYGFIELLSIICCVTSLIIAIIKIMFTKREKWLWVFTGGVYVSLVLIFSVHFHMNMINEEGIGWLHAFVFAFYKAMQVFSLNVEFNTVLEFTNYIDILPGEVFTLYVYGLYALAPVLIVSNIISMFVDILDNIRFACSKKEGTSYVFSEMNIQTVTMAKRIRNHYHKSSIIFTDLATAKKENVDVDKLIEEVHDIDAICLKKDLGHLDLTKKSGGNEIFIIGDDETKNLSLAIALNDKYKDGNTKTKIYFYTNVESSKVVIDSLDKGNKLVDDGLDAFIEENKNLDVVKNWSGKKIEGEYSIRCFDTVEQIVQETLVADYKAIMDSAASKVGKENNVSFTIVGTGNYGMQFLKAVAWMFQIESYAVRINAIDCRADLKEIIAQQYPELLERTGDRTEQEAWCDVYAYPGINVNSSKLDDLILSNQNENFANTDAILVALGDDEKNIKVALHIRELYARVLRKKGIDETHCAESPIIYAVVRSKEKADAIQGLGNYGSEKYNIKLIGDFSAEYSYDRIMQDKTDDKVALHYHLQWVIKDGSDEIKKNVELYEASSYCQESSKAQVIHQRCLNQIPHIIVRLAETSDSQKELRKRIEHSRWNAYMRGIGYQYHLEKSALGKLHKDLVAFNKLSKATQEKDVIDYEKELW